MTTVPAKRSLRWDLDSIFMGGSFSEELRRALSVLEEAPERLRRAVEELTSDGTSASMNRWQGALELRDRIEEQLVQARAFVGCLMSQDVNDAEARLLSGRVQQLRAGVETAELLLKDRIRSVPGPVWQLMLVDNRFRPIGFQLQEVRDQAAELLPADQESLVVDLSVDGYRSWERLYYTIAGRLAIPWQTDGVVEMLSPGQAYNKFANADPDARAELFGQWTEAWAREAELFAAALNHLSGFRLSLYRRRGWDSPLARALKDNRMSAETLNAMWSAVEAGKADLVAYQQRKAKLLGLDALSWYDEHAPISNSERLMDFEEGAAFVVDQFQCFSPRMAELARDALSKGWVESEDRAGKDAGGYCTKFPLSRESRIFMTFGGSSDSVFTLAHELGHAFHNHVQWDLPLMARGFTMSTAETASTFAEMIVSRAAVERAAAPEEKLALLDAGLKRTVAMFMNIHARFLFEQRFYDARKKGLLSVDQLNDMMVHAQREAFQNSLAGYHPQFWASKLHFYGSGTPFYNFPYTFGFLFSAGIYARSLAEGPGFERKYVELLRDTGRMTTEALAKRHLGADLTKPEFWQEAVKVATGDVREFLRLTGGLTSSPGPSPKVGRGEED